MCDVQTVHVNNVDQASYLFSFITARKRSLRRLCFYRCLSVHNRGGGMRGCLGGMRGCSWGACVVAPGACMVFFQGGMHGFCHGGHAWFFARGACVVFTRGHVWLFPGGMCGFFWGVCVVFSEGHAWFFPGGVHGFFWGGTCVGYDEIWSMSGRYASYWNAFLFSEKV